MQQAEPPAEVSSVVAGLTPREPELKGGDAEDERQSSRQKTNYPQPALQRGQPADRDHTKRETKSSTHQNHATARHATTNPHDGQHSKGTPTMATPLLNSHKHLEGGRGGNPRYMNQPSPRNTREKATGDPWCRNAQK
ncbi:Hypothetical predicted protein [Pelobates cultripes]|uniref:Uncharacterized protein n=1 Tax=Pelobates cultripes TaxID=61616 RepID=A0AAD1RF41_PELCU|nr:Hypothetical predicted protein [Pelobates cultripes]